MASCLSAWRPSTAHSSACYPLRALVTDKRVVLSLLCSAAPCTDNSCSWQITTVDEAKQFYPLFGLGANVALIFSGRAVKYFSQVPQELPALGN